MKKKQVRESNEQPLGMIKSRDAPMKKPAPKKMRAPPGGSGKGHEYR